MYRSHKVALRPNNVQATLLSKSAGVSRFAYNWALAKWNEQYEAWKEDNSLPKPSRFSLNRELNSIKREQFPWMLEVSKCAPQESIKSLGNAFKNFFAGRSNYPKFKRKGQHDSFTLNYEHFGINTYKIRLAKIGWIRTKEEFRFPGSRLISVTVSKRAGKWFASVLCELPDCEPLPKTNKSVGVDVGVREYVTSDNERYQVPRAFRTKQKQLKRAQQSLARKQKGSKNRAKAKLKVQKINLDIANIRNDWLHKITTELVRNYDSIAIEDLNVKGMLKNHHLALSVSDASFGEFRRQLEYKTEQFGRNLVIVDRWYPSSKTCSECGSKVKSLPLSIREWVCTECGTIHDRDLNAALNLKAVGSTVSACGEFLTSTQDSSKMSFEQVASAKQEFTILTEM